MILKGLCPTRGGCKALDESGLEGYEGVILQRLLFCRLCLPLENGDPDVRVSLYWKKD